MTKQLMIRHLNHLGLLAVVVFLTGCQTFSKGDVGWGSSKEMWGMIGKKSDEVVFEEPEQLAVIWSDTAMVGSDGKTTRGFAGRMYFNNKKNKPVRVEGELTVYAYDDSSSPTKTTADRLYKFREEELQSHYSPSGIGPSYSFYIPWDPIGGERKSIALVPVFKSKSGQVVSGGQSLNILPGKATEEEKANQRVPYYVLPSSPAVVNMNDQSFSAVRPQTGAQTIAQYSPTSVPPGGQANTSTIDLPRSMIARMNSAGLATEGQTIAATNSDGTTAQVSYGPPPEPARTGFGATSNSTPSGTSVFAAPPQRQPYGKPGAFR